MIKYYCLCLIFLFTGPSIMMAQEVTTKSHRMDRELFLNYENDLIFTTDQYYTSGANIVYSKLIKSESSIYRKFSSKRLIDSKLIARLHYGHKIFTPSKIRKRDFTDFDRPYAGWHYFNVNLQNYPHPETMNKYVLEAGMVGEKSGIGNFHQWWHHSFGITQPKGWQYEIENEPILNIGYSRMRKWPVLKNVDFITESGVLAGNGTSRIYQEVTLKYGKMNRLFNSGYSDSRLSFEIPEVPNTGKEEEEGIIFYGVTASYVANNIFIEGSFIENNSVHTEEAEEWVIVKKWGFMYSNYYSTFYFTVYTLSSEVVGGKTHRYLSLNLAVRF